MFFFMFQRRYRFGERERKRKRERKCKLVLTRTGREGIRRVACACHPAMIASTYFKLFVGRARAQFGQGNGRRRKVILLLLLLLPLLPLLLPLLLLLLLVPLLLLLLLLLCTTRRPFINYAPHSFIPHGHVGILWPDDIYICAQLQLNCIVIIIKMKKRVSGLRFANCTCVITTIVHTGYA